MQTVTGRLRVSTAVVSNPYAATFGISVCGQNNHAARDPFSFPGSSTVRRSIVRRCSFIFRKEHRGSIRDVE